VQFNYLGADGAKSFFLTEIAYLSAMGSWAFYRLWEYPTRVIWSATSAIPTRCPELALDLEARTSMADFLSGHFQQDCVPGMYKNVTLLCILFVLHCWWFFLLVRIAFALRTVDVNTASSREYEGDMDSPQLSDAKETSKKTQ
jgi:hypothetical protein